MLCVVRVVSVVCCEVEVSARADHTSREVLSSACACVCVCVCVSVIVTLR